MRKERMCVATLGFSVCVSSNAEAKDLRIVKVRDSETMAKWLHKPLHHHMDV